MENLEGKLAKYRNEIPYRDAHDAFKVFYETRDAKIRENLIIRYMPIVKKVILNLGITDIEEEDLTQIAYEDLIKCIDSYNPYNKSHFQTYVTARISWKYYYQSTPRHKDISLTSLEIYSNEDLEEKIINDITKSEIMSILEEIIPKLSDKQRKVLNDFMNIDECNNGIIAEDLDLSAERVRQIKNTFLKRSYLRLCNLYPNISFYSSCDSIQDSHEEYTRKLK